MEVQNTLAELHALKQLYGLLQNNRHDHQNATHKEEQLGEGARILLKKLLDCATEKVLEACSKITAAKSRRQKSRWSSLLDAVQKLQLYNSQYSHEKDLDQNTSASSECKFFSTTAASLKDLFEPSEVSIYGETSQNVMEQCRVCQKCGRKQIVAEKENLGSNSISNNQGQTFDHSVYGNVEKLEQIEKAIVAVDGVEKSREKSVYDFPSNLNCIRSLASSSGLPATRIVKRLGSTDCTRSNNKSNEQGDFLADVANSVMRIALCISSLKGSGFVDDVKDQVAQRGLSRMSDSAGFEEQMKDSVITENEFTSVGGLVSNRNKELTRQTSRRFCKHGISYYVKSETDSLHQTNRMKTGHDLDDCGSIMNTTDITSLMTRKNDVQRNSVEPIFKGLGLPSERPTHKSTNDIVQSIKSLNKLASQSDSWTQSDDMVYSVRVPLKGDDMGRKARVPLEAQDQIIEDISRKLRISAGIEKVSRTETSFVPQTADPGKSTGVKKLARRDKKLQHQVIPRPTLLDYMSSDSALDPSSHKKQTDNRKGGIQRKGIVPSRCKILQYDQESDDLDSGSSSSSTWITQRTSESISDSESYASSSQFSDSQSETSSYVSLESSRSGDLMSDYSSEDNDLMSTKESNLGSIKHSHGMASRRHGSGYKPLTGRLKRLKDKLALVFHHHHHHHHHHHYKDNEDEKSDTVNDYCKRSTWKKVRGVFPHRDNAKNNGKGISPRTSRSVVKKNHTDHQGGQLHGFVQGLMRQVRYSKKSNQSKVDKRKLVNHGRRQKGAKLHWWKMIRHQRTKLPKKGHIKIGMAKKKQRLIANH